MLEKSRRQGASIFVYLIFCLLIVIFVINFGPQGGQGGGCGSADNVVVSVDGEEASQSSYHIAYSNPYNEGKGREHTYFALEMLIRREMLAQEAERRGLRVNSDLVEEQIKKGHFYLGGYRAMIPGIFDENGLWSLRAFKGWVGQLNVSKNSYIGEQKRGLMAAMMAELLQDSVQVSREEALSHYLFENNTVQYDVVAFKTDRYRSAMKLTDADVERFLTTHAPEVEARYKTDERTYKATKPALKLRQIFIAKLEEPKPDPAPAAPGAGSAVGSAAGSAAPAAGSAAGSGAQAAGSASAGSAAGSAAAGSAATPTGAKPADPKAAATPADKTAGAKPADPKAGAKADKKPEKKVGMKIEDAKAKLEAARTAIAAGKQKFADAAKQLSTDEAQKATGGELGWRTAENAMLGDKAVSDAVKALKPGEMTPVITTDRGAYLVIAEAKREGDLTFDQVKHEIAKELARDVWSKEAAKRAALSALDKARAGTAMNLEQLYDKEEAPETPGIDIQQMLNDPNMSNEDKQRLIQMLMQQQKQGSFVIESKDQPAAWKAQADGAGGSATAPTTGSAAPAAKPAPAAAPKTGSAAPAAKPAPAAAPKTGSPATPAPATAPKTGSAAPAAGSAAVPPGGSNVLTSPPGGVNVLTPPAAGAAAAGAPPAPAPDLTPSKDQLPEFGTIEKPTVARFGPAPRSVPMSGLGTSKEAVDALFDDLKPGMLAKRVYEADDGYVVMQLITRSQPKVEDFEKDADRLIEELRRERGQVFLNEWLKEKCQKLVKDGRIRPNAGLIRESDDKGNPLPVRYRPCMSFDQQ